MTKPVFLKIARSYLLALSILCLLNLMVMTILKDHSHTFSHLSGGGLLLVSLIRYSPYKLWHNLLISMGLSILASLLLALLWPNGLTLTAWHLLGLTTAFAGLSIWAHVCLMTNNTISKESL